MNPVAPALSGTVVQVSASPGGVPNHPITYANITPIGIEGDGWRHPHYHGPPKRSLLLIASEVVDQLAEQGFPVFYGALGENITTRGLDRRLLRTGQTFQAGQAVIQLTQVRFPCGTLDVYGAGLQAAIYDTRVLSGDATSPVWAMSGFYATVLKPGILRSGDSIALVD